MPMFTKLLYRLVLPVKSSSLTYLMMSRVLCFADSLYSFASLVIATGYLPMSFLMSMSFIEGVFRRNCLLVFSVRRVMSSIILLSLLVSSPPFDLVWGAPWTTDWERGLNGDGLKSSFGSRVPNWAPSGRPCLSFIWPCKFDFDSIYLSRCFFIF